MAWTAPRTWTDGELVTAAIMNAHVRDNLLAALPHLIARKTSDQSVTSSTAFVDDTALTMPVGTTDVWFFKLLLRWEASTTGDIKISFAFPASGRVDAVAMFPSSASGTFQEAFWSISASDAGGLSSAGAGAGTPRPQGIEGVYIGGGTAGNLVLRWAQQSSDGTATKVLAQSTLWGMKLV